MAALPGALDAASWDAVISLAPTLALAQITDMRALQTAMAEQGEAKHTLSVRLSEVDENARRRRSAELPDRMGQSLAAQGPGVEPRPRLPNIVETALFRVTQEGLTNRQADCLGPRQGHEYYSGSGSVSSAAPCGA